VLGVGTDAATATPMAADHVTQHDRRAWWMRHWLMVTTYIQTIEVFERRKPALLLSNDATHCHDERGAGFRSCR
jgi:hypothetical protein